MNKGFLFTTDALIAVATVMIAALVLTFPYSIEEGNEANIYFIKQELPNKAVTAFYSNQTAGDVGLKATNIDFNIFDYAECFVLYDYNVAYQETTGQGNLEEKKFCMGKSVLR